MSSEDDKLKPILAYSYQRGYYEGHADLAKLIREKIRNNKDGNPYQLLVRIENELLSLIDETNSKLAKMRNRDSFSE